MSSDRWQELERLFHEAVALPEAEWPAFVASRCGGDEELKCELMSLLDAERSGTRVAESLAGRAAAEWAGIPGPETIIGSRIDGYVVISLLGVGGMGETYLAEDSSLGRRAAIKLLPKTFSEDARRVRRFVEEARAASALNHPGIITVYGAGAVHDQRYIATEYIDGENLRQRLAKGVLARKEALDIAFQAAAALAAAHAAGIVHRDIKPENIMIRSDGFVKIIDFGLAKPMESGERMARSLTNAGDVVGTVDYMSPEQSAGRPVDARTDVYSLTVVLYEMLTGELPRGLAIGAQWSKRSRRPLSSTERRLFHRGLATDPANRYQTAEALGNDIGKLQRTPAWHAFLMPAAAAMAVLALALGAWLWSSTRLSGPVNSLVVMPLQVLGAGDQAHLADGMSEAIITRLGSLPQLRVPPGAAIRANEDPFDAARRLRVDAVLTGSVQRAGDRLRVTARLSRTSDRKQLWAAQYDEDFTSIFSIQDAIAGRVADNLGATLSPRDRSLIQRHEFRNSEAYDLYLRAREQWALRTPENIRTAIRMYQNAIAVEPGFALAWAGLADCYNLTVSGLSAQTRAPLARSAAEKALALDPQSAEAHTAMAFLEYKFEWRWADSDREFRRARDLNPKYALAHHWYGEFLKLMGRYDESVDAFRKALAADPFSIPVHYDYIESLLEAGRISEARAILQDALAIDSTSGRVLAAEADVLEGEGHLEEAVEIRLRAELMGGSTDADVIAFRDALRTGGQQGYRMKRLTYLLAKVNANQKSGSSLGFAGPGFGFVTALAQAYADVKDRAKTLYWLELGIDQHDDIALLMKTRRFDFLRTDPKFMALESRVGLYP